VSWSAPSLRTTGTLITASIWNNDLVNNILFLKTPIDNNGKLNYSERAISSSQALTTSDDTVYCSGTITASLPAPASCQGKQYVIKNVGTGVVTVNVSGGASNIDGASSYVLTVQYFSITVQSDGTQWWIL
jgi:hypothetical protein